MIMMYLYRYQVRDLRPSPKIQYYSIRVIKETVGHIILSEFFWNYKYWKLETGTQNATAARHHASIMSMTMILVDNR